MSNKQNASSCPVGRPSIGGQAVMEGVMMNGNHHYTVAVRDPGQNIRTEIFERQSITEKYRVLNLPIIRGVIRFVESMVIGFRTLDYSADVFIEDEEPKRSLKPPLAASGQRRGTVFLLP